MLDEMDEKLNKYKDKKDISVIYQEMIEN